MIDDSVLDRELAEATLSRSFQNLEFLWLSCEYAFFEYFERIASSPPEVFIVNLHLPWRDQRSRDKEREANERSGYGLPRELKGAGGEEVFSRLRTDKRTESAPVVVASGSDSQADRERIPSGVWFFKKPPTLEGFREELHQAVVSVLGAGGKIGAVRAQVFILHGHDHGALQTVARAVERLGLEAVILHEQENRGRTVIEKLEALSNVSFAIAVVTPDDLVQTRELIRHIAHVRMSSSKWGILPQNSEGSGCVS